jgi:hypothetical protein
MWPIQSAYLLLLFVGYSTPPWLFVTLHFYHDRCNWSSPSLSSTTFQNFPSISDLLSEVITDIAWKYSCVERCVSLSNHESQQDVHYSEILRAKVHLENVSVDDMGAEIPYEGEDWIYLAQNIEHGGRLWAPSVRRITSYRLSDCQLSRGPQAMQ